MRQQYSNLPKEAQQRFREGVVSDLQYRIKRSGGARGTGNAASRLGDPEVRRQNFMGATGSDEAAVGRLEDSVSREGTFHDTYRMTNPSVGSKTASIQGAVDKADEVSNIGSTVARAAGGDVTAVIEQIRGAKGLTRPVADAIAARLTSSAITPEYLQRLARDPAVPIDVLQILASRVAATAGGIPAALSATAGVLED